MENIFKKLLHRRESGIFLALLGLMALITCFQKNFIDPNNLYLVSRQIALTAIIALTEAVTNRIVAPSGLPVSNVVSIQTNLIVAARFQIPKGSGVFLLNESDGVMHGKRIGVMISATLPPVKR